VFLGLTKIINRNMQHQMMNHGNSHNGHIPSKTSIVPVFQASDIFRHLPTHHYTGSSNFFKWILTTSAILATFPRTLRTAMHGQGADY
jgi:hypothetical protein